MLLVGPNIFMGYSAKLYEASSLAPEHVIKSGELQFPIGLLADWKSLVGCLFSDQADQFYF
jgi:hypothetical protein